MLTLCANNWDTLELHDMTTYLSNVTLLLLNSLIDLFYQLHSRGSGRIWLDNVACSSFDSCLRSCEMCPSSEYHNCGHSEDVTIECGKSLQLCNPDSEKTCFTLLHNFYYFIINCHALFCNNHVCDILSFIF